jgi:hypothetical protein
MQGVERRVGFSFTMRVAEIVGTTDTHFFERVRAHGARDYFEKRWEEVVFPNSPYFPNGMLTVGSPEVCVCVCVCVW